MNVQTKHFYVFGPFRFDPRERLLLRDGNPIPLAPKVVETLSVLVENAGHLVDKDDLLKRVWPDTFVEEGNLNKNIFVLRRTLGQWDGAMEYIETVPKRGYRFIAPVHGQQESSLPASITTQYWRWSIVGIIAIVVVSLVSLGLYRRVWHARGLSLENVQITKLTNKGTAVRVGIAPDGRYVAYASREGEKQRLWLHQVATNSDVEILGLDYGDFLGLTFSPDSNYIYFVRSDKNEPTSRYLYSVPVLGGPVQKLIGPVDSPISFSPTGREFVYQRSDPPHNDTDLMIANADGSGERLFAVIHNVNSSPLDIASGPAWSPDGQTIAVPVRLQTTPARFVLETISVADGRIQELFSSSAEYQNIGRPVWLPSGGFLLVPHMDPLSHRTQLWTVSFPGGIAHRLTNDLYDYDTGDLDITRDGRTISAITEMGLYNIWVAPAADLSKARQITSGELPMIWVAEAHGGKVLSVSWDFSLWDMNPDGSQRTPFGGIRAADWLEPCGHFVLFVGGVGANGGGSLMRADADGTHATQLDNRNVMSPACPPEGKFAFYVNVEQPQRIWRVPVEGGKPVEIAKILGDSIVDRLSVSPDGRFLAYPYSQSKSAAAGWRLAIIPVGGGTPIKTFNVSGGIRNPRWSPDGKGIEYLLIHDEATNLWEQPLSGGEPKQMTKFTSEHMFDFYWSSDGSHLLLTRGSISSNVILIQNLAN